MNTENYNPTKLHIGHNIKRLRDILGIKQDAIAFELGMTQQNFSNLEQKSDIDNEILEKISLIMKISVEAIKNFNEEGVVNIISSTLHDNYNSAIIMHNPNFNPIDKMMELYEKLLAEKDKTIAVLEKRLEK
ncbi:MAG: helix-turn-helix domain-containing protein [Bacteroidales bacterium]|jgi:transcriptional regulator with XRE-family HTH domain|nr:helix-turn-helix domain-containing protein [Bacteroidales bacterium]